MYDKGWGVPPDDREALRLFLESANLGLDQAQFNLGVYYRDGRGTEPDPVSSYVWFSLAARQEVKEAQARANTMQHYLTPAQLAEAERRLAEWKAVTP
jgi:TPR repeat protein